MPWWGSTGSMPRGQDAARVVGRELEEAADRVAVAVAGYRQIPSSRSTPAIVCTAASRSCLGVGGGDRDPQARLVLRHRGVGHRVQEEPAVLDLLRHREDLRVVVDHHRHDLRVGLADVDALLGEPPAQERHVAPQLRPQLRLRGRDPQAGEQAGGEHRREVAGEEARARERVHVVDELLGPGHEAALPAQALREGAEVEVHLLVEAEVLGHARARWARRGRSSGPRRSACGPRGASSPRGSPGRAHMSPSIE